MSSGRNEDEVMIKTRDGKFKLMRQEAGDYKILLPWKGWRHG
jgi:hypothetical protein